MTKLLLILEENTHRVNEVTEAETLHNRAGFGDGYNGRNLMLQLHPMII